MSETLPVDSFCHHNGPLVAGQPPIAEVSSVVFEARRPWLQLGLNGRRKLFPLEQAMVL